jgi:hypothetical protein
MKFKLIYKEGETNFSRFYYNDIETITWNLIQNKTKLSNIKKGTLNLFSSNNGSGTKKSFFTSEFKSRF